jgi:hypothetical protein
MAAENDRFGVRHLGQHRHAITSAEAGLPVRNAEAAAVNTAVAVDLSRVSDNV